MKTGIIRLDSLVMDPALQIRSSTSAATVAEYRDAMRAGVEFPPITVAAIDPMDDLKGFRLVDGWHRVLAAQKIGLGRISTAIVDETDPKRLRWLAANANRSHGLRLGRKDRRLVFRAYVQAGEHRHKDRGQRVKSAREMARDLQGIVSDRRIPEWMRQDFPKVYEAMQKGGLEENPGADFGKSHPDERHRELAHHSLSQFTAAFRALTSDAYKAELLDSITSATRDVAIITTGEDVGPTFVSDEF
ncbi:hypothetical protein N181_01020 [Sinorhizobium fredii USDA 205]|uniref:ParB-like N-terminal domain-containing protein n=1 Tax=Rhizobium fredii TaxID=380 RepID=A0A844ACG5_RHIFR|nr:ParB N-terminal domain-containing protein [Sinorhizobium fredii]KSV92745.1 hypothetical protein N181_01020 [Sinorhizobium fredii USDA 205]MQX10819.1 hypothetical protein [Sinorhizobium fredii]GEC31465.1 hypothetical protein EFR01_16360 [Sinorhizobium fredii]GLS09169.1 hypothetical protein GCM10007864_27990 [Sinorhizobium fredii]